MATATLISPGAQYPLTPHSHSSGYPVATAMPSMPMSGMPSQAEPPRPSDSADSPPHRQSLPPISEVISATNSHGAFSQAPTATPMPVPTFTSPFSVPPRPYTDSPVGFDKASPTHNLTTYSSRQEPFSPFAESSKTQTFGSLSGPASYSPSQPSPPSNPTQARPEHDKGPEQLAANGGYRHSAPTVSFAPTGQVPAAQLPYPPAYAVSLSPRHTGPLPPSPYDSQRMLRPEEVDGPQARQRYDMSRHMEAWSYQDCLLRIASSSRTIFNFAEGYGKLAQEQHTSRPIPERLPTEKEVADMLGNVDYIRRSLESVRDVVQQSNRNELAREGNGKSGFEDDDVMMYDSNKQPSYGNSDGKKRRGRAAPPGKCHSCNRVDTPEWRRGPDGARTLCNACGLHYAKLERKRALEARTVGRPRQADDN